MLRLMIPTACVSAVFAINGFTDDCPKKKAQAQQWGNQTSAKVTHHEATKAPVNSIVKTAATNGNFKTLVSLLIAADLTDALKGDGQFTVFAPTDDAFAKLPKGTLETLLKPENKKLLTTILTYHVIPNKDSFRYENLDSGDSVKFKTLAGKNVTISKSDSKIKVNDSKITVQNLICSNGSIQVIDSVLMPPTEQAGKKIPEIAKEAGMFKTLLAALTAAELAEAVGGDGPFTVFAPTDDAFAKLPEGTVTSLLKPENKDKLVAILKYHVVSGKKTAKDLVASGSEKTLQEGKVSVMISDGSVMVNKSKLIKSDISASNGVIHVIDTVLLPQK
jgi:transforming growth factor-beta-induced protein